MTAAAAVALLIAGLGLIGEQALAAAQDAVHEVVRAVHPGNEAVTVMESWEEDVQPAEQSAETR